MSGARKIATNLSARASVVQEAKKLGLNLSEIFESALAEAIRRKRRESWLAENRDAIAAYNAKVAHDGVFSDDWRTF